jgi:hypothetical protein
MMGFVLLGSELGEDAVIDRHHLYDVRLGLGVGWHAFIFAHGFGACIVCGKRQFQAAESYARKLVTLDQAAV